MKRMILAGLSAVMIAMAFPAMALYVTGAQQDEGYGSDVGLAPMFVQIDIVSTLKNDTITISMTDGGTLGDIPITAIQPVKHNISIGNTSGLGNIGDGATKRSDLRMSVIGRPAFGYSTAFAPVV